MVQNWENPNLSYSYVQKAGMNLCWCQFIEQNFHHWIRNLASFFFPTTSYYPNFLPFTHDVFYI